MTTSQWTILAVLAATVGLFLWGRWRHDVVALAALLVCVLLGLVPAGDAFAGFGHPAVITVAGVLVLSVALERTGVVDAMVDRLIPRHAGPLSTLAALSGIGAVLSAFMNNVGAMALLMPAALQIARRLQIAPSRLLMPLAFATILGGMTTLIGTPPNLIVSGFMKTSAVGREFGMFDFTPVGAAVAATGLLFMVLVGWRLVPRREGAPTAAFSTGRYLTEAVAAEGSDAIGKTLRELEEQLDAEQAQLISLIRNRVRLYAPGPWRRVMAGDVFVVEAEPTSLTKALRKTGLKLAEAVRPPAAPAADGDSAVRNATPVPATIDAHAAAAPAEDDVDPDARREIQLREVVVMPRSLARGRTATHMDWRGRYGVNLLAISRQGGQSIQRLASAPLQGGDVLLLQGSDRALRSITSDLNLLPLAGRDLRIPSKRRALITATVMLLAVGAAALGLVPSAVAFALGALVLMASAVVPPDDAYQAVDWSVVVLLGAMMPVAAAMESTGLAAHLARTLLHSVARGDAVIVLVLLLVVTMTLSDFMNNAATAAVMCPIALGAATELQVRPQSFLMAVAVGASCAFLTPIGHQNNTLILGPAGLRFGDYWRLGLPLELLVVAVATPMLLWVWG